MAVNTQESEVSSAYQTLTTNPNKDQRRPAALLLFRDYLLSNRGVDAMQVLGYSEPQIKYVSDAVDHLALTPIATNSGLEGRSDRENESAKRVSLVDSSRIGVGEYVLGLPPKLSWLAKDKMSANDIRNLENMGALMRITVVDPGLLADDYDDRLVQILHGRNQFPGIGLRPESFFANAARKIGYSATYSVERTNDLADVQINLQVPRSISVLERWRDLPTNATGLHFFGMVPAG